MKQFPYMTTLLALLASASFTAQALEPPVITVQNRADSGYKVDADVPWMAIMGDSSVTGAAAHPSLKLKGQDLVKRVGEFITSWPLRSQDPVASDASAFKEFGIDDLSQAPTRVLYSSLDFEKASKKAFEVKLEGKSSQLVDTPAYSFGYMVGRSLDFPAKNIVLVGQDGKRFSDFGRQLDRILEVSPDKTLPSLILSSFVANDICHPENFSLPLDFFETNYRNSLGRQIQKLHKYKSAPNKGTDLFFLAPLDVLVLLDDPDIAKQEVPFPGFYRNSSRTCGELREGHKSNDVINHKLATNGVIAGCKGLFTPPQDKEVHRQRVRDLQRLQLQILSENIDKWNQGAENNIRAHFATSVRNIKYQTGDLANDCFHPGLGAHSRIARSLLENELAHYEKH